MLSCRAAPPTDPAGQVAVRRPLEAELDLRGSWGKIRPGAYATAAGRGPSNEALLARWGEALERRGLREAVRRRKLEHLRVLGDYLASGRDGSPIGLVGVTRPELTSFFFSMYPRRYPRAGLAPRPSPVTSGSFTGSRSKRGC